MDFTGKPNQQKEISASGIKAEKIAYGLFALKRPSLRSSETLILDVGETDIIMRDGKQLVFVEVRFRKVGTLRRRRCIDYCSKVSETKSSGRGIHANS